jgi:hypothetical protein
VQVLASTFGSWETSGTYADLALVTWNVLLLSRLFPEGFDTKTDFSLFLQWHDSIVDRPAVKTALQMREHCIATMEDTAKKVLPKAKHSDA